VRGTDVVDEHQVADLPRLTCSVGLVDLVDHLHDILVDGVTVAEAGIERQPFGAVYVHSLRNAIWLNQQR
jgi:hypothetical protein